MAFFLDVMHIILTTTSSEEIKNQNHKQRSGKTIPNILV